MIDKIKLKAYAKINLSLYITGQRDDGYHLLDSVFIPISLYDEIVITKTNSGIKIKCDKDIPTDKRNTAYKAAALMMGKYDISGVEIDITKNIPSMAGLGGGSSDAAAVLVGMNTLFDLKTNEDDLNAMGLKIGADVPFFLGKGPARVQGIGEILTPIKITSTLYLVIIKPKQSLSTVEVYSKYDSFIQKDTGNCTKLIDALSENDLSEISKTLFNDLQKPAIELCSGVKESIEFLKEHRAKKALMTGSGSCVFGMYDSELDALYAKNSYEGDGQAFIAGSINKTYQVAK